MFNKETFSKYLDQKLLNLKLSKLEEKLNLFKQSYPNYSDVFTTPGQYNMGKWIQALKDIYVNQHQGLAWKQALDTSTQGWNQLEVLDFSNWVRTVQEGAHLKYKKAEYGFYEPEETSEMPGYFIPNALSQDAKDSINVNFHSDIGNAKDAGIEDVSPAEKKKIADKQRKKIISRLDSVEKLIRSDEGNLLSESEFDSLMESIYALKKKISALRKKTSGELFYQDLIIRQANVLAKSGNFKAASFLYVVADGNASPTPAPAPAATEGKTDGGGSGLPGQIPSGPDDGPAAGSPIIPSPTTDPSAGVVPTVEAPEGEKAVSQDGTSEINTPPPIATGIEGFLDELDTSDMSESDDDLMVYDSDLLVTEAQAAEAVATTPKLDVPAPTKTEETIISANQFDKNLDSLLSKVTISDVVGKLEEISKVFKTREIPRQLAIVDMMLDQLGLASFFPALSEAINKSLESNNYVLTRIDGIMSQLSGALKIKDLELTPKEPSVSPETELVRSNLEEQEKADKARKEMRQQLADKALEERGKEEAPELEVTEEEVPELTAAPAAPPAPAAPAPTPAAPPAV